MLNCIESNAFRIVGTTVDAKLKDRLANISKIKAYTRVGREITFPLDRPEFFEELHRDSDLIARTSASLGDSRQLAQHAMFWLEAHER